MALIAPPFDRFLLQAVRALGPYRTKVVLAGGCANALYRYHPGVAPSPIRPLVTFDVDVATPNKLPQSESSLQTALAAAGLQPSPGDQPTNKYKTAPGAAETLEFLCPITGTPTAVRTQFPTLIKIQGSCTAEALDYLDLLLMFPWSIDLRTVPPLAVADELLVRIPNPVSYIMQKILIRSRRTSSGKRAKDSYYIYELALLLRNACPTLTGEARRLRMPSAWKRDYLTGVNELLGHDNAEGIQDARDTADANGQAVTEDMVYRTLAPVLAAIQAGLNDPKGP